MILAMLDSHRFVLFLGAALLLAVAPGPGMIYVLARSLAGGRREGILSALGTFFGGLVHVFAAAVGLSAVLATSAMAYAAIKYAGAAYLVFLGTRMIVQARRDDGTLTLTQTPHGNTFAQGIATEVFNPKTALFFLSFIPQFVDSARGHIFEQFVFLGAASVTLNTLADFVVVFFAAYVGGKLNSSAVLRRRQRTATGLAMVALGTYVAVGESN
jgi:threonine/homoserine/homoserine lactone efflux protein